MHKAVRSIILDILVAGVSFCIFCGLLYLSLKIYPSLLNSLDHFILFCFALFMVVVVILPLTVVWIAQYRESLRPGGDLYILCLDCNFIGAGSYKPRCARTELFYLLVEFVGGIAAAIAIHMTGARRRIVVCPRCLQTNTVPNYVPEEDHIFIPAGIASHDS